MLTSSSIVKSTRSIHQLNCISSSICHLSTFMELSSHPKMHPKLIIACSMLSSINFSQLVRRDVMLSSSTTMRWIAPWIDVVVRSCNLKLFIVDLISSKQILLSSPKELKCCHWLGFFFLLYSCNELNLESTGFKTNYSLVNLGVLHTLQHLSKAPMR